MKIPKAVEQGEVIDAVPSCRVTNVARALSVMLGFVNARRNSTLHQCTEVAPAGKLYKRRRGLKKSTHH